MKLLTKGDRGDEVKEVLKEENKEVQKYLMFKLNGEEYAIEVYRIKEIIRQREIIEVPNTTPYVKGVISLRGIVIPVLDLKRYLGFSDSQPTHKKARLIIIGHRKYVAGLPVDSVEEVIDISSHRINPIPQFMEKEHVEFFNGVIEYRDRFIMVLKTDAILDHLKNETHTSLRLTKEDENNPPIPPLEKGGKGGFERPFSGEN